MIEKLTHKKAIEEIKTYESDTFSATGWNITEREAREMFDRILPILWNDRVDGVLLTATIEEMREEKRIEAQINEMEDTGHEE